jgi:hypothetical protein
MTERVEEKRREEIRLDHGREENDNVNLHRRKYSCTSQAEKT